MRPKYPVRPDPRNPKDNVSTLMQGFIDEQCTMYIANGYATAEQTVGIHKSTIGLHKDYL